MDQATLLRGKPGRIMLAGAAFLLLVAIPYPFAHLRQGRRAANRGASTVKVEKKNFGQVIRLNGTTQASRSFVVLAPKLEGAQVGSMVITKLVPAGTHVKKDAILVEFDPQAQTKDYLVFVGAFLVQIVLGLRLRIEFDEDGIFFHMGAGGNQLGDDHGTDLRSFELGGQDHEGTRGLRRSIQANYLPEILLFHFYSGLTSVRSPPALPEVREGIRDRYEKQKGGSCQHDSAGLSAQ